MTTFSTNSEQGVLASLIEDGSLIPNISFLCEEDFYHRHHRVIFKLIMDGYSKGQIIDLPIMMDIVPEEAGGIAYVADLFKNNSTTRYLTHYARKVLEMSLKRQAIDEYSNAIESMNGDCDYIEQVATTSQAIDKSICRLSVGDVLKVEELINQSMDEMEKSLSTVRVGISSGIPEIDERLGYQNLAVGEITFIGAQSKNGKTLYGNTIAARADLLEDECCHIFSIEMPALGMFNGVVSAMSGVPSNFYARQDYYHKTFPERYTEWMANWGKAAQELNRSQRVTIDGKKDVNMQYIVSEMRKQHQLMSAKGKKLKLVIVDHLHRISFDTSHKQMTYAMGDDVRMLKNTASELGISVILLGQLKEDCKDREPTAFDILDTARVRHEIQAFIGTRIFRDKGKVYFGIYSDAHRYADHETVFQAGYMRLMAGVLRTLPDEDKYWNPNNNEE